MRTPARLAVAAALLCVCGCSSSPPPSRAVPSIVTVAPPSAQDLEQVRAAAESTLSTSGAVFVRLDSAAIFGSTPKPVVGRGRFDFSASRGTAEVDQPAGAERIIFLAQSVFVAQPNPHALLPAGKVWISAGLTEQSLATNFPQFVTQVESLNPALILSEVDWGAVSAAPTSTTGSGLSREFAVQVDLSKAQAAARGPSADAFRRAIGYQLTEMSGATVPTQVTVYVGLDAHGRVVRMQDSPAGAGVGSVTMDLSDFGTPVPVSQPARVQVADISSLAPGGEREKAGGGDSDGA